MDHILIDRIFNFGTADIRRNRKKTINTEKKNPMSEIKNLKLRKKKIKLIIIIKVDGYSF